MNTNPQQITQMPADVVINFLSKNKNNNPIHSTMLLYISSSRNMIEQLAVLR